MKTLKQVRAVLFLLVLWAVAMPAHAALAIIVHPSNSLSGITADEAADIYLAKAGVFVNGKRAIPVDQAANSPMQRSSNRPTNKGRGWRRAVCI